nr:hypothetical protein [Tanacetum cinerariifolium]
MLGTPEESFAELPLYCHNLKVKNQGTITHIGTDDEDRFEIFFTIGAVIRTIVLHMRPLIIIDGAHIKGEFFGTMYLADVMDGNNNILPLAYRVGKFKTFRSSDWFLRKLKECIIGKQDHLTIISDGAVYIALAIKNVFPNALHACKAYRISDFEESFSTLRDWLPSIANKLDMIGLEKWARFHFPDKRPSWCNTIENRIIPGPAGILQLAQLHKTSEIREGGHNGEMSSQEYVRKITEEASEDDHFTRGPRLSAVQYLAAEGSITI